MGPLLGEARFTSAMSETPGALQAGANDGRPPGRPPPATRPAARGPALLETPQHVGYDAVEIGTPSGR